MGVNVQSMKPNHEISSSGKTLQEVTNQNRLKPKEIKVDKSDIPDLERKNDSLPDISEVKDDLNARKTDIKDDLSHELPNPQSSIDLDIPGIEPVPEKSEDTLPNIELPKYPGAQDSTKGELPASNHLTDTKEMESEKRAENTDATDSGQASKEANETRQEGLTDEEKEKVKKETGWSDEIIDAIRSMDEYEVYKKAGLVEAEINGKKCLIRNDIDWNQKDAMGRTNKERVEQGLVPINKDGNVIELHHIGQHKDSPLAELTVQEHRGKENYNIRHDGTKESEIDRQAFAKERAEHWESRANEGDSEK